MFSTMQIKYFAYVNTTTMLLLSIITIEITALTPSVHWCINTLRKEFGEESIALHSIALEPKVMINQQSMDNFMDYQLW